MTDVFDYTMNIHYFYSLYKNICGTKTFTQMFVSTMDFMYFPQFE